MPRCDWALQQSARIAAAATARLARRTCCVRMILEILGWMQTSIRVAAARRSLECGDDGLQTSRVQLLFTAHPSTSRLGTFAPVRYTPRGLLSEPQHLSHPVEWSRGDEVRLSNEV